MSWALGLIGVLFIAIGIIVQKVKKDPNDRSGIIFLYVVGGLFIFVCLYKYWKNSSIYPQQKINFQFQQQRQGQRQGQRQKQKQQFGRYNQNRFRNNRVVPL